MCTASTHRNFTRRFIAGAVVALALSPVADAYAQGDGPRTAAPAEKISGPKQIGRWAVTGWNHGSGPYCTAERPLPGAAGAGATLQFILVRGAAGYRLGLASEAWELQPPTTFPVELIAAPVFRSDANAVVVAAKVVVIDLGPDRQLMQKLATAPMMEVKTAQTVFKLPLDTFGNAVAELDACFGALKRPAANPFAASSNQASSHRPASNQPAKVTPVGTAPAKTAPAAAPAAAGVDNELIEERTFLTVNSDKGPYRLEALVVRPVKADGRLPIALITHGKNGKASDNQQVRADLMLPQARDFAARGWLAVAVVRRGYGQSDGIPGVSRGAAYMSCENGNLARGFDIEADDLAAALEVVAARPDADGTRAIAVGQSLGGGAVLALAARRPAGLRGVVNVSGGAWRTSADGNVCDHDPLVAAMATFGARTRIPTLWLYAQNDSLFPPELVKRMRDAYGAAGGRAELEMFPPIAYDGHNLFADFAGRVKWLRALDRFLQAQQLPNANVARLDRVMSATKLPAGARPVVEEYLSVPSPKVLAMSASGAYWVANPTDAEGARKRALTRCREKSGAECSVAMENNELVQRIVTGSMTPQATTR